MKNGKWAWIFSVSHIIGSRWHEMTPSEKETKTKAFTEHQKHNLGKQLLETVAVSAEHSCMHLTHANTHAPICIHKVW